MSAYNDTLNAVARSIISRHVTSFFLNGAPGSGKSYFLSVLTRQLPLIVPRTCILGPYILSRGQLQRLTANVLRDCVAASLLDEDAVETLPIADYAEFWRQTAPHISVGKIQELVILIDVEGEYLGRSVEEISVLFSAIRALESAPELRGIRLHHIVTGCWDHAAFEAHYEHANVSFPYTVGMNYAIWDGLDEDDIRQLLGTNKERHFSRLLHELTGGHAAIAQQIIHQIGSRYPSFTSLIQITDSLSGDSPVTEQLLNLWKTLPEGAISFIEHLLLRRYIPVAKAEKYYTLLRVCGIARVKDVEPTSYIAFRSWYVEQVIRNHLGELGISEQAIQRICTAELVPDLISINEEAYRLINDIEVTVRNFVSLHIAKLSNNGSDHVLQGRAIKAQISDDDADAFTRAKDWRNRSSASVYFVELNPLISYCSTRDLANIIREISRELNVDSWAQIAASVEEMAPIRDAVMHHQLVDRSALDQLSALRSRVYSLLST